MSLSTKDTRMNNILGKITLILLTLALQSFASSLADFKLTAEKKNPFEKEAVEISFVAHQKDKTDVMFFFFTPKKSKDYKIVLLQKESKELAYHEKKTKFRYLLFPLKSGKVTVDFNFIIKTASDQAVAQVYEGSRDNVKWIETDNSKVKVQPLELNVKKLQRDVALVGDFKLSSKIDKTSVKAYESVNVKYYLQGICFDEFHIEPIEKIADIEIFKDVIKHYNKATKDGYKIQREFSYALVGTKSFTIPSKEIHCYSPKSNLYYSLRTKEYKITVKELPKSELLDKADYPKKEDYTEEIKTLLIYLIIFLSGFITAKIKIPLMRKNKEEFLDIQNAKSAKELLYILMHSYAAYNLESYCNELENIVYRKNQTKGFSTIKKGILTTIKESMD